MLQIALLALDWGIGVKEDEELFGLPRLVLPPSSKRKFVFIVALAFIRSYLCSTQLCLIAVLFSFAS